MPQVSQFFIGDPAALGRTLVVGLLAYVALVAMLRVSSKRTLSQLNAFDLIVTVALGSTLATILLSNDTSLAQGLVAFAVLAVSQLAITWGSRRSRQLARAVKSEPTALVYRGHILREQMARERVLEAELLAVLRAKGVGDPSAVDLVVLETSGEFSVVPALPDDPTASSSAQGVTGVPNPSDRSDTD
jgi:uncharacterized membrane protein YcaP (DUF421 family)